ncbi:MFS transporter [Dethiothermospora halolimnae]|uniref:MFS transporter n=1 Tax=Dethiothermospora halolimnae TaxID=3114390 RepID=UPI003CCBE88F
MSESIKKELDSKNNLDKRQKKLWNKNFFLLWQGQLVSSFGDSVYNIALGFWILAKTGSTGLMGGLMAASTIPRVFISPFAGTFVDRHNRKVILIVSDIIRGLAITLLGVASYKGIVQMWMVLIGGVILGICGSFFGPAVQSSIPDIVPKDKLVKANSAFSMLGTGTGMLGKLSGGYLFQILGAPFMFLINGLSFIFSAFTEMFIKVPNTKKESSKITFMSDMKSGFQFVRKSKGIKNLYITVAFLNFFGTISITLLLPFFNEKIYLGAGLYGMAMTFSVAGMFVGFSMLSIINILNRFRMFILGGLISAGAMVILPFMPNVFFICILLFINGLAVSVVNSILQSSMQAFVPGEMRGKVFGFKKTLGTSLIPMGMATGGLMAEIIPIGFVMSGSFIIVFMLFCYLYFVGAVKNLIQYNK